MYSSSRTPTEKIKTSAIGAAMRLEKIQIARSIATAAREQRQQQQQVLERKLLANEMGLTELRNMIDDWKGDKISLQKLALVAMMKEKECIKTRKLVADTRNKWGSTALPKKLLLKTTLPKTKLPETTVARRVAAHCA